MQVFTDPLFEETYHEAKVNYGSFVGEWEFSTAEEIRGTEVDYMLSFNPKHRPDQVIRLGFKTLKDRMEFCKSTFTTKPLIQSSGRMRVDGIVNSKRLP